MGALSPDRQLLRFGVFELDLHAGELRRSGSRVKLQEQPFQILKLLLERPGDVVTHEEIINVLWPNGTIVEYEHSVKTAIKKLRQALSDDAGTPRYVENLPRRGYRFIYPIESADATSPRVEHDQPQKPLPQEPEDSVAAVAPVSVQAHKAIQPDQPSRAPESQNLVGKAVSHYRVLSALGAGGMGVVYKAHDSRLNRFVAIKVLPTDKIADAERKRRFIQEAQAASAPQHYHHPRGRRG